MKTIKTSLFVILMVVGATSAYSQAQFALGIKAGPNFASINAKDAGATYDSRTGYHFGAFGLFKFTKIGIQPEILFSQQGAKVKVDAQDFDANFSYINIPVMLKLYTIAGINLQVGPQFGFLSRAEIGDEDVKSDLKNADFSVALGAGWDLPFGLSVDARYNLGLSGFDDGEIEGLPGESLKNQVWQISLGYKLIKLGN